VSIADLIVGVRIALGLDPVSRCPRFANANGEVTMTELMQAVLNAEVGCTEAAFRRTARAAQRLTPSPARNRAE
jgi:hypothetical protein